MRSSPRPRHRASARLGAFALAAAIALVPARSEAIAPALLFVLKQIAQDMAKSMLKDALVSGLAGMGCKGIALASALEALDLRRGIGNIGGAGAMLGLAGGGSAKIGLGAAAMPSGMPNLSAMAGMPAPFQLTEIARMRLEAISFFLVVLLVMAVLVQLVWNGLRGAFTRLPRLSYWKALGLVFLWGLLFSVVLSMISGARELMTPGAWEKQGATYRLKDGGK